MLRRDKYECEFKVTKKRHKDIKTPCNLTLSDHRASKEQKRSKNEFYSDIANGINDDSDWQSICNECLKDVIDIEEVTTHLKVSGTA